MDPNVITSVLMIGKKKPREEKGDGSREFEDGRMLALRMEAGTMSQEMLL